MPPPERTQALLDECHAGREHHDADQEGSEPHRDDAPERDDDREEDDQKAGMDNPQKLDSLTGTHTWLTEEGPVVIAVEDNNVFITESLDRPTTEHLEQELFGAFVAVKK